MEAHHHSGNVVMEKSKSDVDTVLATMVSTPQLIILKQNCVTQENWSKNGISKQVHVVVKNLVFQIEIGSAVDLNKCTLDVKLLYDTDREDPRVEVTYIKNEPMEYKVKISESGIKATVEIRIKVLSSQHEDMLFRVRISAYDPTTQATYEVLSNPVKVIAKYIPGKKKESIGLPQPGQISPSPEAVKKRSSVTTDQIASSLARLEQQQAEHAKYLSFIVSKLFMDQSSQGGESLQALSQIIAQQGIAASEVGEYSEGSHSEHLEHQGSQSHASQSTPKEDMEMSLRRFLSVFSTLDASERKEKVDELLDSFSETGERERVAELLDAIETSQASKKLKKDSK